MVNVWVNKIVLKSCIFFVTDGLNHFTSSLRTLCHKTIEDTLVTIRNFEAARLEYDAYRTDLETLKSTFEVNAGHSENNSGRVQQMRTLEGEVNEFREKYERLKSDVIIKMKFLDENRVKVMRKQLVLFQHAISMYFSGNAQALDAITKQFKNVLAANDRNPDATQSTNKFQSFLEKN